MSNFHKQKERFLSAVRATALKPVLRWKDFEDFDFEQAWNWLKKLEHSISISLSIIEKRKEFQKN